MSRSGFQKASGFVCASCRQHVADRWATPLRSFTTTTSFRARSDKSMDSILAGSIVKRKQPEGLSDFANILGSSDLPPVGDARAFGLAGILSKQPHRIHIYATKHNTHITVTAPPKAKAKYDVADLYKPPEQNQPMMSFATGMIGFRKAGRGSYDAAYQLASYVLKQLQEKGKLKDMREIEVVLRGWGAGREAVTKALLGQEGRLVRPKITAVTDATRLKFGGSRSPNPRRLG
ncbi:hypothetical protein CAC42_7800 [Sphaceloma murrayae]|uniref:37S ribosomal protein S18, mitochondrial n=1 Tax=Sphaceloma murrayae TaxID=2082308 RepID=A0A2K1QY47_9PEZI|nr:hypothetical protein CAC42_7800 [Sphaceloma murrayae]